MGFFNDVGNFFKDPARALTAIGTFGTSEVVRAAGAKKAAKSIEAVYGGTATGIGVGFLTGGPSGAIVGGASGFGRGVAGALNGDEGSDTVGGAAKYAAITGGITGAIKGTGVAGYVRNAVFTGTPKVGTPALSGGFKEALGTGGLLAFLSQGLKTATPYLKQGEAALNLPEPVQSAADKAINFFQGGTPSPAISPSVPLPSPSPAVIDAAVVPATNYWPWVIAALALGYFILRKKKR